MLSGARSVASSTYNHVSELTCAEVPNYKISINAAALFLALSCISCVDNCGSATSYFSLIAGTGYALMAVNQNWDGACEYASKGMGNLAALRKHSFFANKSEMKTPVASTSEVDEMRMNRKKDM